MTFKYTFNYKFHVLSTPHLHGHVNNSIGLSGWWVKGRWNLATKCIKNLRDGSLLVRPYNILGSNMVTFLWMPFSVQTFQPNFLYRQLYISTSTQVLVKLIDSNTTNSLLKVNSPKTMSDLLPQWLNLQPYFKKEVKKGRHTLIKTVE